MSALTSLTVLLTDEQLDELAGRIAARLCDERERDEWLDVASAANHLGLHRDTLRRRASAGLIPFEQDRPGCRIYFRRSDLDAWRRAAG